MLSTKSQTPPGQHRASTCLHLANHLVRFPNTEPPPAAPGRKPLLNWRWSDLVLGTMCQLAATRSTNAATPPLPGRTPLTPQLIHQPSLPANAHRQTRGTLGKEVLLPPLRISIVHGGKLDGWEYAGGVDGRLYYPVTCDGRSNKLTAAAD